MKWVAKLLHCMDRKNRHYVSEMDQFLQQFDREHPQKSASQIKEINKHKDIFNRPTPSRINWN